MIASFIAKAKQYETAALTLQQALAIFWGNHRARKNLLS